MMEAYRRSLFSSSRPLYSSYGLEYDQEQLQNRQLQQLQHRQRSGMNDYQPLSHFLVSKYGMDRRGSLGLVSSPQGGFLPFNMIEQERRATLLRSALDCGERVPARLSYGVETARDCFRIHDSRLDPVAKRAIIAEDQEIPRKRPRRKEFSEEESAREVRLLHQLWQESKEASEGNEERGKEDAVKLKVVNRRRGRKRRTEKRDKVQVKIDTSGKRADKSPREESNWEDHVSDANNKSWIQEEEDRKPGESQADGWVSDVNALQVKSQNAIEESVGIDDQGKLQDGQLKPEVEEEKVHQSFVHSQKTAVNAFKEFLGSESDAENSDDEMDFPTSDDESNMEGKAAQSFDESQNPKGREGLAYDFFVNVFSENEDLRKLYEEHCNCGAFECIVCAALGTKLCKRFPDLVGLVQHAQKVLKTKKRQEHRGYARAVCGLLGWDPLRDPVLPKTVGFRPRGCIPPADEETQGDKKEENNIIERSSDPKEEKSDEGNVVGEGGLKFDVVIKDEKSNPKAEKPYIKSSDSSVESSVAIKAQG